MTLPPGRWDEARLLDWLTAFLGRGSDLDVPVRELPRMFAELKAPAGVTDVIFVADARCRPHRRGPFRRARARVPARRHEAARRGDLVDLLGGGPRAYAL